MWTGSMVSLRHACVASLLAVGLTGGCDKAPEQPRKQTVRPTPAPTNKPIVKPQVQSEDVVVDSAMSRHEALAGNDFPKEVLDQMALVDVHYIGFDGRKHRGQIVVRVDLAAEVRSIFNEIERSREPIAKVIPIVRYGWNDDRSMAENNTSGFNYRTVNDRPGGNLSKHARGIAIDVNPRLNPFEGKRGGWPYPHRPGTPGTLSATNPITLAFRKRGWTWGGSWSGKKDFQHFVKR